MQPQVQSTPAPFLVNDVQAARLLGVSIRTLTKDRAGARLIPFVRVGTKIVRYSPAELELYARGRGAV